MEENEEKTLSKKELKLKAQEMKLEEKQRKMQEKADIKAEKERRKNSFGRKVRNFFLTILFVIILVLISFYLGKEFLTRKEKELSNEKMGQVYETAISAIDSKDYKEAIKLLKSIDKDYDKYSGVSDKLKEIEQLYLNEYLVSSDEYLKEKKYEKALGVLDNIEDELKNTDAVNDKISEIHIAKMKNEVEALKENKNVIDILKFLIDYDEISDEVTEATKELIEEYKNQFVLETRLLLKSDYAKARTNINAVKKLLPDDKDIKDLEEELNNTEPTPSSLLNLKSNVTNGKLSVVKGENAITNVKGTGFTNYILSSDTKGGEVEFDLNKEYSRLSGNLCIQSDGTEINMADAQKLRITIYGDGKVIYFSNQFSGDLSDINFSVDVSGVKKLKISFKGSSTVKYFVADPMLIVKK